MKPIYFSKTIYKYTWILLEIVDGNIANGILIVLKRARETKAASASKTFESSMKTKIPKETTETYTKKTNKSKQNQRIYKPFKYTRNGEKVQEKFDKASNRAIRLRILISEARRADMSLTKDISQA